MPTFRKPCLWVCSPSKMGGLWLLCPQYCICLKFFSGWNVVFWEWSWEWLCCASTRRAVDGDLPSVWNWLEFWFCYVLLKLSCCPSLFTLHASNHHTSWHLITFAKQYFCVRCQPRPSHVQSVEEVGVHRRSLTAAKVPLIAFQSRMAGSEEWCPTAEVRRNNRNPAVGERKNMEKYQPDLR